VAAEPEVNLATMLEFDDPCARSVDKLAELH